MGKKQKVKHSVIVRYAKRHPELHQKEIGLHFGITQSRVSAILRAAGEYRQKRGRPLVQKTTDSDLQHKWEQILHAAGLGMDRGLRINNQRIIYGPNPLGEISYENPTF